jgi:hypothetical protein
MAGEIKPNTNNLRLLFCGLFLLEQVFEIKDNHMTYPTAHNSGGGCTTTLKKI